MAQRQHLEPPPPDFFIWVAGVRSSLAEVSLFPVDGSAVVRIRFGRSTLTYQVERQRTGIVLFYGESSNRRLEHQ